jgi:hypothetical protein
MYFSLLMAAGFGLFVSEEALNVWVRPSNWYIKHITLFYCLARNF